MKKSMTAVALLASMALPALSADLPDDRSFPEKVTDATTTAEVKAKLLANATTKGLKINVDTRGDVVTLTGTVASAREKQLAEALARNTGEVRAVSNKLVVRSN